MEFIKNLGQTSESQFGKPISIKLNEVLSYETKRWDYPEISLHLKDARDKNTGDKLKLLREGLKELASTLKDNEAIKIITATSWIVAEHPNMLRRLGFTVETETKLALKHIKDYKNRMGKYSQLKDKDADFPVLVPEEQMNGDAGYAYASREKLIELYGSK